ncbi:FKBP-type peptidyl-prolyl cis-trans isomerase [Pseudobacteriovorax antillogorgiicola]|uniref:Peptidyl-prolyl cis-trans isomerase n=2 Tax=Pseudobacteriovorax antillogorgiicola TaxID=1513793 RepID=A0A1Y6BI49_9BACT|nr:peptidylprolyl isomerase [Pseudobacteriovorax antillogorgiicola]TCS55401.1 FKBP-type peptidyl-prolyl cis-trans isomerase SlyD [Pseudobacteriovorax antillogorgiicola]SMF12976.1 FKBP-type peptidyl-prolyl cis-trans isomerase SlyD [Pseudobacteriovorax antillogorgiicola]
MIVAGKIVSIAYQVRSEDGQVIDASSHEDPWVFTHGDGQMVKGVERALLGHEVGDKLDLVLAPEDAYGERDPDLTSYVSKTQFSQIDLLEPGTPVFTDVDDQRVLVTVKEVKEDKVLLDMNHPLAGQTLQFSVEVLSVREPSK